MTQPTCPHCSLQSFAMRYPLWDGDAFKVVCDAHPLVEGHILLIPIDHVSCMGSVVNDRWPEFVRLHFEIKRFINSAYGSCVVFEHGVIGQTVLHAHVHFLPFHGAIEDIVPEKGSIRPLGSLGTLQELYYQEQQYLFLEVQDHLYAIDTKLGYPRFFRDRIALALGIPGRGNWQTANTEVSLTAAFERDVIGLRSKWAQWSFTEGYQA